MKKSHLKTVTKKHAGKRFRSLSSYLNRATVLRNSKSKQINGNSGFEVEGPSIMMRDERGSNIQPPTFEAARRAAICSVMEEEQQHNGISLTEARRQLLVRYLLISIELL